MKRISIQWHDPQGMGFWLRGVKPDGSFYGELMYAYGDPTRRVGTTVEGSIPAEDWAKCQEMITMCKSSASPQKENWVGQLASWTETISDPDIFFQYQTGDEDNSTSAEVFLKLKNTVEKHLSEQSAALVEFSKKTHNKKMHDIFA